MTLDTTPVTWRGMPSRVRATRRVVRAVAAAATSAFIVTGCGADAVEPTVRETKSPPATATRSATATPTSKEAVPDDPVEFVRHYVNLINKARMSGDVSAVLALSAKDCEACRGVTRVIEEIHDNGGTYDGDPNWTIPADGASLVTEDPAIVQAYIVTRTVKVVRKAGEEPEEWPGQTTLNEFTLKREGDAWKVENFVIR